MNLNLKKITGDFFGGLARGVDRNIVHPVVQAAQNEVRQAPRQIQQVQRVAQQQVARPFYNNVVKPTADFSTAVTRGAYGMGKSTYDLASTPFNAAAGLDELIKGNKKASNEAFAKAKMGVDTGVALARAPFQTAARVAVSANPLTDPRKKTEAYHPNAPLEKFVFGSQPIESYASQFNNQVKRGDTKGTALGDLFTTAAGDALAAKGLKETVHSGVKAVSPSDAMVANITREASKKGKVRSVAETNALIEQGKIKAKAPNASPVAEEYIKLADGKLAGSTKKARPAAATPEYQALNEAAIRSQNLRRTTLENNPNMTESHPTIKAIDKNLADIQAQQDAMRQVGVSSNNRTQYSTVDPEIQAQIKAQSTPKETLGDYGVRELKNNKDFNTAVERVAKKDGISVEQADLKVKQMLEAAREKTASAVVKVGDPVDVTGKVMKDPNAAAIFEGLSKADRMAKLEEAQSAAAIQRAARQYRINTADPEFIHRYETGQLTTPNELAFRDVVQNETNRAFRVQQELNPNIARTENYLRHEYAGDPKTIQEQLRSFKSRTNNAESRAFPTYREAAQSELGLQPKYKTIDEIVSKDNASAVGALERNRTIAQGLDQGVLSLEAHPGWKQVEGMRAPNGSPVFASSDLANRLNATFQQPTEAVGKGIQKAAKVSGLAQEITLSGGVPNTWLNGFGVAQVYTQALGYLRAGVIKDAIYGLSAKATRARFTSPVSVAEGLSTPEFIRQVSEAGGNINPIRTKAGAAGDSLARKAGNIATGQEATFKQLMPNIQLSIVEETYKKYAKKRGHEEAVKIAADTVNRAQGFVDETAKGRSTNIRNAKTATLFAPKYRETIVNQLANAIKAWNPKGFTEGTSNLQNPSFRYSRRMAIGMASTYLVYDQLNKAINGHGMAENRQGQRFSLQIPVGEKDEKGNQDVINIPFFPSTLTVPRAIYGAFEAASRGDVPGIVGEAGKMLASPIQVGTQIIANKDYFTKPIYNDANTARDYGVQEDSAGMKIAKATGYAAKQLAPGWIKAGIGALQGDSAGKVLAQATEAPVKFGKVINPDTLSYFKNKDEFRKSLRDKNEQTLFDKLNPIKKDINGNTIDGGKLPLATAANYGDLIANEDFRNRYQEYKKKENNHDPLWDLTPDQLRSYMQAQVISKNDPGGDSTTVRKLYDRLPDDFFDKRSAYFEDLKAKGVLAKDDPNYKPRPKMPKELQGFADSYQTLPHGTGARSKALRSELGQQYIAYLNANKLYNNQERADLGLPPLEDTSSSYASKGGGGRSAKAANPDKYRISTKAKTKVAKAKFDKPTALAKVKTSNVRLAKAKTSTTRSKV